MRTGPRTHSPPPPDAVQLDPLAQAERLLDIAPARRSYTLVTEGRDPGLDALSIVVEVLKPLTEEQRQAVLAYVTSRFLGEL